MYNKLLSTSLYEFTKYEFIETFTNVTKIFATEHNTFFISNKKLYTDNYIFKKHNASFTLINNFYDLENLKKIVQTCGKLYFLYNNGDVFIMNSNDHLMLINVNIQDMFIIEEYTNFICKQHNLIWLNKDGNLTFIGGYINNPFLPFTDQTNIWLNDVTDIGFIYNGLIKSHLISIMIITIVIDEILNNSNKEINFKTFFFLLSTSFVFDVLIETYYSKEIDKLLPIYFELLIVKNVASKLDVNMGINALGCIILAGIYCNYITKYKPDLSYIKYIAYNLALLICNYILPEKITKAFMPMIVNNCSTLIANEVSNLSVYQNKIHSTLGLASSASAMIFSKQKDLFYYGFDYYNMMDNKTNTNGIEKLTKKLCKQNKLFASSKPFS